jgi:hypothetical protein
MYGDNNNVSERSIHIILEASGRVGSKGLGSSLFIVVDTFIDKSVRHNIASSIWCNLPTNSRDLEKLDHDYEFVTEFEFNRILDILYISHN